MGTRALHSHERGALHLRRGDGSPQLPRGQTRHTAREAPLPAAFRALRHADGRRQRRDGLQRSRTSSRTAFEWYKSLSKTEIGGNQDLRGERQGEATRAGGSCPMGTPMRELLEEHAGGMLDGYALPRRPSRRGLDRFPGRASTSTTPLDFDSVPKAGSRIGTGTMIVLDDKTCPVAFVLNLITVLRPRVVRLVHSLPRRAAVGGPHRACDRAGRGRGWATLRSSRSRPGGSRRDGPSALLPRVRSSRCRARSSTFREDFERHIREKRCPWREPMINDLRRQRPVPREGGSEPSCAPASRLGFNLPYFCWHPALHSVGACRQCAVKVFNDERDTRGRIVMSCMTAATDGLRCSIDDPEAKSFRAGVIEWLMLNHPARLPDLRRRRGVPPAGHDRHDRSRLPRARASRSGPI